MGFDEVKEKNICLLSNRAGPNIIYPHLQSRIIFSATIPYGKGKNLNQIGSVIHRI